jgi:GT2 family glycosyltransferase
VRDNASTDGTAEALAREVPEAEVDAGSRNLGFAAGVNTIIRRSDAPWFFALNSDAWPEPGALAALIDAAERRPRAAVVVPRIERPDGSLEHSTHPFPSLRVAALTAAGGHHWLPRRVADRMFLEGSWVHDRPRPVDWAVGAAMLIRRAALDELGGFDEQYFMYAEDIEWCWRATRHGWEVFFDPSAVVRHVGNASGARSYREKRTSAYLRNTYRFYRGEHSAVAAAAYRALNRAGTVRAYTAARLRGDRDLAQYWARTIPVHLRPVGVDGAPQPTDPSAP